MSWALGVLGLDSSAAQRRRPPRPQGDVQRRFREQLMAAHPDHGGDADGAAQRIAELTEARRILLG